MKSVITNPPLVQNGNTVHKEDSLLKAVSGGTSKIKDKLRKEMRDDQSGEVLSGRPGCRVLNTVEEEKGNDNDGGNGCL